MRKARSRQLTGVYAYKLGDAEIIQVFDGARTFPIPDNFIANVSKEDTAKAYAGLFMPAGQVTITFIAARCEDWRQDHRHRHRQRSRRLCGEQRRGRKYARPQHDALPASIPKSIDIVLISHFHGDHISGLKNADGSPAFPNARDHGAGDRMGVLDRRKPTWSKANGHQQGQLRQRQEGVRRTRSRHRSRPARKSRPALRRSRRRAIRRATPLSSSASGGKSVMVQGDVANASRGCSCATRAGTIMFDNDAQVGRSDAQEDLRHGGADKLPVIGYHFPFPSAGYVEKDRQRISDWCRRRPASERSRLESQTSEGRPERAAFRFRASLTGSGPRPISRAMMTFCTSKRAPPPPCCHGTGALSRVEYRPRAAGIGRGTLSSQPLPASGRLNRSRREPCVCPP